MTIKKKIKLDEWMGTSNPGRINEFIFSFIYVPITCIYLFLNSAGLVLFGNFWNWDITHFSLTVCYSDRSSG